MRYTVTKQLIQYIGRIWMPGVMAAQQQTLDAHDMSNLGDPRNRDDVEGWLMTHSGDFQSIEDFRTDFSIEVCARCDALSTAPNVVTRKAMRTCKQGHKWQEQHVVHEWAKGEESEDAYCSLMYDAME